VLPRKKFQTQVTNERSKRNLEKGRGGGRRLGKMDIRKGESVCVRENAYRQGLFDITGNNESVVSS